MPFAIDDLINLIRTARRVRQDQGGGDTSDDEARRLRSEELEEELDELEEED
jgi:hypothetical protein